MSSNMSAARIRTLVSASNMLRPYPRDTGGRSVRACGSTWSGCGDEVFAGQPAIQLAPPASRLVAGRGAPLGGEQLHGQPHAFVGAELGSAAGPVDSLGRPGAGKVTAAMHLGELDARRRVAVVGPIQQ